MPVPAKVFRNKTPAEAAEIATAKVKAAKKSAEKRNNAALAEAEAKAGDAKMQGLTQASVGLTADAGMEALFEYSKTAAKYEVPVAVGTLALSGLGAAATDGYASSALFGVAQASAGRLARLGIRKAMSA